jgi:hypothetical protein
MLEWKILAAAFSALIVISMVLVGNSDLKDRFGSIVGKLTDWLGGTPVSLPGGIGNAKDNSVSITLYPMNFTLNPDTRLNLTLGESYFENFNGQVSFDFQTNKIYLKEKSSTFMVSSPMQNFVMEDFSISRLTLKEMKFTLMSSQSNITNENGSLDIQGFSGTFSVQNSSINLAGNVTKITGDGWVVG